MDRLASPHEEGNWPAHRAIANWVEEFTTVVEEMLPLEHKAMMEKRSEDSEDDSAPVSTGYMDLSPTIEDPE